MKVAVAGGTGLVGQRVVARLRERGDDVVVLARSVGVDITTGKGLEQALRGVDVIIDVTSLASRDAADCLAFFSAVARNLQVHGAANRVGRIVTLSIVGISRRLEGDDVVETLGGGPFGHYDGKLAQEEATEAGAVPTVILRATQFHGFAGQMIDWMAKGGVLPVPTQPVQTVDIDVVADHLVRLTSEPQPHQRARYNLAGPEKRLLADLVRGIARARGQRLLVIPVWLPGQTAKRIREGALQAPPDAIIDGGTFQEWLAREYPAAVSPV